MTDHDTQPVPLAECMAEPMSRVDGCPGCDNTELPRAYIDLDDGYRCSYLCSDCGRAWTTDYETDKEG